MYLTYRGARLTGRSRKTLLLRGGAARTFASIVGFLAIVLLLVGAYGVLYVITHPLEGESTEMIGAAVLIALAVTMLFYLIAPRANARSRRRREPSPEPWRARVPSSSLPQQRMLLFDTPRDKPGVREPLIEFTLKLSESPRDSALQESGGDVVHGLR
jgi:hypothetical protein